MRWMLLLAAIVALGAEPRIVIDWENRKMTACPSEITRNTSGQLHVKNANPLYTYRVNVESVQGVPELPSFPWSGTPGPSTLAPSRPSESSPCDRFAADLAAAKEAIEASLNVTRTARGYPSIKASESLAAWQKVQSILKKYASLSNCPEFSDFKDWAAKLDLKFPHQIEGPVDFRPNRKYLIRIEEQYLGQTTDGGEKEFECKPESHTVSLSFGPAASRIGDRTYSARKVPGSELNQLVVNGNSSFRPVFGALVNFALPFFNSDWGGLALSAGPAFKLASGRADTSSFGFFAGPSIHLWRLLYITPGVHFGEFADIPAGFRPFDAVPANFGELTPVKRWTTRFGIAVTFRTSDFRNILGQGKTETETPTPTRK